MKVTCPECRANFVLEEYLKDLNMVAVIKLLPEFVPHQRVVWEYVELFHIGPPLNSRKIYRLLSEVLEFFKGGFTFQRERRAISRDGVAEALRMVCNADLKGGLTSHNYLKKIMVDISQKESERRCRDEEKKIREREQRIMSGDRVEGIADVPGKVRELLGKIV